MQNLQILDSISLDRLRKHQYLSNYINIFILTANFAHKLTIVDHKKPLGSGHPPF